MRIATMKGALKVKSGHDTCSLSGSILGLPSTFVALGAQVAVNIGGVPATFTLDTKGHGKSAQGTFDLKLKLVKAKGSKKPAFQGGDTPFKLTLRNGSWTSIWAADGIDLAKTQASAPFAMTITLSLNGQPYTADLTGTARTNPKSGATLTGH